MAAGARVTAQLTNAPVMAAGLAGIALSSHDEQTAQAAAGVSLAPPELTAQVLTNFTLDVLVNCGTHADAASIKVTFDPAYLQVVAVAQDESFFPNVLRNQFDNAVGVVNYDAGSLLCHSQGSCPAGVIRVATITFRAIARTFPTEQVDIYGQVTWEGNLTFDGQGNGGVITITSPVNPVYLPLAVRHAP